MHPLTHPLPVTEHVSLLDVGYLTPARATNSGLNSKKTDAKSVFLRPNQDQGKVYLPCIYGVYTPFKLSRNATISSISSCGSSLPT